MVIGNQHVLLIEDDLKSRFALKSVLQQHGHVVSACADAREAEEIGGGPYDVAIIDVRLPTGPGTVFAARLKQRHPDTVIIFITAYDDLENADTQIAGAVILVKPIDMGVLLKLM